MFVKLPSEAINIYIVLPMFLRTSIKVLPFSIDQLLNSKYDHLRVTKCKRRPMVIRG